MLFVGTSIIHPSTEGVFLLCNILDLLIYSSKIKRPVIFEADNVEIINNYAMLFSVDGKALDEIMAKCANYNNQDVLLYLQDGQVAVRNEEKNKVELYQVKKT